MDNFKYYLLMPFVYILTGISLLFSLVGMAFGLLSFKINLWALPKDSREKVEGIVKSIREGKPIETPKELKDGCYYVYKVYSHEYNKLFDVVDMDVLASYGKNDINRAEPVTLPLYREEDVVAITSEIESQGYSTLVYNNKGMN